MVTDFTITLVNDVIASKVPDGSTRGVEAIHKNNSDEAAEQRSELSPRRGLASLG